MIVDALTLLLMMIVHNTIAVLPSLTIYNKNIDVLLGEMTDEEKVGQMTQITLAVILIEIQQSHGIKLKSIQLN